MIPTLLLRALLLTAFAAVEGLSVVSAGERTQILIETDGRVTFQHQMLSSPPRIVVDLSGAEFHLSQAQYLDINRGGVRALRSSQFQTGVVRVVIDLDQSVDYRVQSADGVVLVSFDNPADGFEPWSSGPARTARTTPEGPSGGAALDRSTRPVDVGRPPVIEAPQQARQPSISVEFRNTPIGDVLSTFADFSGRSIVPGQGVGNQDVTAAIRDQPWDQAMQAILEGQGLTATEMSSGIIMVTSLARQRELETQEETVTRSVQLQYVTADSMAAEAQQMMGGADAGTVAVNKTTNSLVLTGRRSVVGRVIDQLGGLDEPTPQVTVQVRILSVRRSDFEGLGIHYELKDSQGSMLNRLVPGFLDENGNQVYEASEQVDPPTDVISLFGNSVSAVGNAAERIPQATFEVITTLLLGQHSLVTWIDAVQRLELAELQADPVVTVLDNRQARVHVGERTPIRVIDRGSQNQEGPVAQVRTEETGVIIELTPRVIGTNHVLIDLHAERSEINSFSTDAGYVFGTQETDTEILLQDGETAVISGLTTKDLRNTTQGIPFLMDLPLIGALFRTKFVTEEKEDLLIMVTPYIDRSRGF